DCISPPTGDNHAPLYEWCLVTESCWFILPSVANLGSRWCLQQRYFKTRVRVQGGPHPPSTESPWTVYMPAHQARYGREGRKRDMYVARCFVGGILYPQEAPT
ncbi:unnamed protein product, partial [Ectocarpus sp. 12 AP-2014]